MKPLDTKVKKFLATLIFLLPLLAIAALAGVTKYQAGRNTEDIAGQVVEMKGLTDDINCNKNTITAIVVRTDERYANLVRLIEQQNRNMADMKHDIATLREDTTEIKVSIAAMQAPSKD